MNATKALIELKRETEGEAKGWSAELIQVGRFRMKRVVCHDRGGCLNLIDTLGDILEKTRRRRPTVAQSSGVLAVHTVGPSKILSHAIDRYLKDLGLRKKAPGTIDDYASTLEKLLCVTGDIPLAKVDQDHIRELWEAIRWIPRNPKTRMEYRDLSFWELVEQGKQENVPAPSVHVFNRHWRGLRAFFARMVKLKELAASPMEGLDLEIDTEAEPKVGREFTNDELQQIFEPKNFLPWALKFPHRFWIPQLGLYTGARVSELSQLKVRDVQQVGGVWTVRIQKTFDEGSGSTHAPRTVSQKAKSNGSIRTIPLAKPLLDAGFLDYVEDIRKTGHPRLFPHLKLSRKKDGTPDGHGYSSEVVRTFSRYVRGLGVEKGVAMHAFRHTMITALRTASVPDSVQAALTGHDEAVYHPGLRNYQHQRPSVAIAEVAAALTKFKPPTKLFRYKKGMFREQFKDGWRFEP